jgi:hypothetical protein
MEHAFMSEVSQWKALNWELYKICDKICGCLASRVREQDPKAFVDISYGFILKATRTLQAVNILYDNNLNEQAQALVRVLFELRLNFDCFLIMATNDMRSACQRVVDSMMLEKLKHMRASGFAGVPEDLRKLYEKAERETNGRYSGKELKQIAKHGFTGMSIEDRSRFTGHEEAYNIVYRSFSRNVHSTDYVEHALDLVPELKEGYVESRDVVSLYTAHFAAGGIAEFANHVFKCGFERELDVIGIQQQKTKSL